MITQAFRIANDEYFEDIQHLRFVASAVLNKVITTMVIRPLDDDYTLCAQYMVADLRHLCLGYETLFNITFDLFADRLIILEPKLQQPNNVNVKWRNR